MTSIAFDTTLELERMTRYGGVMLALCKDPLAPLALAAPEVSRWSPLEHLAHIALANELVIKNVVSLAQQKGLLVQESQVARDEALFVLARGRIPRARAESPRMVRPPPEPVLADVAQWHRDNERAISDVLARNERLEPTRFSIPHQLLGPLDIAQWARFGAVHTHHHLEILLEILRRTAAGSTPLPDLPPIESVG